MVYHIRSTETELTGCISKKIAERKKDETRNIKQERNFKMEKIINIHEITNWQEAHEYPEGTKMKILLDKNGTRTVVLKLPAGFYMAPHAHMYAEQHIVIKGEYESGGKLFTEGTYRCFDAHENHGPFKSESGAIVLVIWHNSIKK